MIAADRTITYAELDAQLNAAASRLRECGASPGNRVVICAANSVEWIVAAHAIARLRAVLVPISTRILSSETESLRGNYGPSVVLSDTDTQRLWAKPTPIDDICAARSEASQIELSHEIDPAALHSIISTSGTEGAPKGVCLSFRNHLANALGSALNLGVRPNDRWLLNLPLYHVGGLAIILRAAIYGTTVVVQQQSDAAKTWESIAEDRITQMSLVATTLRWLLDAHPERRCPGCVRAVLVGGGPVPSSLIEEARSRGFPILPTYGMTETSSQIATLTPSAPASKHHTAGLPLALAEIEIRNDSGRVVPVGGEGRIHVRGPMVASGYWGLGGRVEDICDGMGWFGTKDVGTLDSDGYLIVHGRLDNVIISGGEKIHTEEIENALAGCAAVARAVVAGEGDAEWGQRPVAYVELRSGHSADANHMMTFLAGKLPRHKLPGRIEIVAELPLLPSGKMDRRRVQGHSRGPDRS